MTNEETKRLYYIKIVCMGYKGTDGKVYHAPGCELRWLKASEHPIEGDMVSHSLSDVCLQLTKEQMFRDKK